MHPFYQALANQILIQGAAAGINGGAGGPRQPQGLPSPMPPFGNQRPHNPHSGPRPSVSFLNVHHNSMPQSQLGVLPCTGAANPFLTLQLLGQAQQLQNLGVLAAMHSGLAVNPPNNHAPALQSIPCNQFSGCGPLAVEQTSAFVPSSLDGCREEAGSGGNYGGINDKNWKNNSAFGHASSSGSPSKHKWSRSNGPARFRANNAQNNPINTSVSISENAAPPSRNFMRSQNGGWKRRPSCMKFHGDATSAKENSGFKHHEDLSSKQRLRQIPVVYDENDVKLWREARKRNYPTADNIEKKNSSGPDSSSAADADLCRQQLKEVLAKQAELGFELPEIPPGYLSKPAEKAYEKRKDGSRAHMRKRPKFRRDTSAAVQVNKSKEPSLLDKLLSSDIKRDNSRLLQALRFITSNSFFVEWPDRQLEFPSISVKSDSTLESADQSTVHY